MTIGIKENTNIVYSIKSNIRQLQTTSLRHVAPISYAEALAQLKNNEYEFLYTYPAGEGTPAYDKVYPNNKAVAQEAVIEEVVIAYVEQSPSVPQNRLAPYYIFRGNTQLSSGYQANFVAGVPAVTAQGVALGEQAALAQSFPKSQFDSSQKIGTFSLTATPTPKAPHCGVGLSCPPTPTPGCGVGVSCPPATKTPTPHCGVGLSCPPRTATPTPTPTPLFPTATRGPATPTPTCTPGINCPPTPSPTCTPGVDCPTGPTLRPTRPPRTPTPTCTPGVDCPVTPSPTVPPPGEPGPCIPEVGDLTNNRSVSSSLFVGQLTQAGLNKIKDARVHHGEKIEVNDWYTYSTGSNLTAEDLVSAFEAAEAADPEDELENRRRATYDIADEGECPVRISGQSPSIFVYGNSNTKVLIYPSNVQYTSPHLELGAWNVAITENGDLDVDGGIRDYLYYEYNSVLFSRPTEGWITEKENLEAFTQAVSGSLELNQKEEERLQFELVNAASSLSAEKLFIGIISQNELADKLPLKVIGATHIRRIHFYIAPAKQSVRTPHISPIERSSSFVLELGAFSDN